MRKYFMPLCWLILTAIAIVQMSAPAMPLPNKDISTQPPPIHMSAHTTEGVTSVLTHCEGGVAEYTDVATGHGHCADNLCMATCAAHCMSVAPTSMLTLNPFDFAQRFAIMPNYQFPPPAVAPDTPPPKRA